MEQHFWDEQYKRDSIIGSNNFQTLYRATDIKDNGILVTIKEYLIKKNEDSNNQKVKELYKREINLLKELQKSDCENFVHIIGNKEDIYEEREENYYYIIREYCMGNLEDFVTMNGGKLEPGLIQKIMNQLNNALKILKDKNIIHRNIKPSNILFCNNEDTNFTMKLSGLNYYKKGNNDYPEINNDSDFPMPSDDDINEKYDLWSIGAIMYFMYFGDYQNIGSKNNEINDKDLKDLIEKCLKNKINRISWNDYFNHKYFNNIYNDYLDNDSQTLNVELTKEIKKEMDDYRDRINGFVMEYNAIIRESNEKKEELFKSQQKKWENDYEKINDILNKVKQIEN